MIVLVGRGTMLMVLVILLLVFWVMGFAFEFGGNLIHILLVFVAILCLVSFFKGSKESHGPVSLHR